MDTAQNTLRVYGGEALVRSGLKTADAKRGMAVNLDADLAVSRFDRKQTDISMPGRRGGPSSYS